MTSYFLIDSSSSFGHVRWIRYNIQLQTKCFSFLAGSENGHTEQPYIFNNVCIFCETVGQFKNHIDVTQVLCYPCCDGIKYEVRLVCTMQNIVEFITRGERLKYNNNNNKQIVVYLTTRITNFVSNRNLIR